MSETKFYSPEDVHHSIESLQAVHGRQKPLIYWTFLLTVLAGLLTVLLLKVDVSVGATGQIRPSVERLQVYPAVEGIVSELYVSDNASVKKGDVLLRIDSASVDARIEQNETLKNENLKVLKDLRFLLNNTALNQWSSETSNYLSLLDRAFAFETPLKLISATCIKEHSLFLSDLQRLVLKRNQAQEDYSRVETLHQKKVISEKDYEQQKFNLSSADLEIDFLIQQTISRWQAEALERELKQAAYDSEATQLIKQKENYVIKAPTDGTAIGFAGLNKGLFIPQGQCIGEISPNDQLQADVFIRSKDVGFIHPGQAVKLQIEAFPYTEWGTLTGRVKDISQDYVQVGQQIAFKAVVHLDKYSLTSSSGVTAKLRRGMGVNARFVVRERRLYQLLYSNVSDAIDPSSTTTQE
jgi:HlyD family secretion protein